MLKDSNTSTKSKSKSKSKRPTWSPPKKNDAIRGYPTKEVCAPTVKITTTNKSKSKTNKGSRRSLDTEMSRLARENRMKIQTKNNPVVRAVIVPAGSTPKGVRVKAVLASNKNKKRNSTPESRSYPTRIHSPAATSSKMSTPTARRERGGTTPTWTRGGSGIVVQTIDTNKNKKRKSKKFKSKKRKYKKKSKKYTRRNKK